MLLRFYFIIGIVVLTCKKVNSDEDDSDNDYSQMSGMDVDKIGMNDDLSKYTKCENVFPQESDIMKICRNNSTCRLLPGPEGYLQVFCDCSNTITETYYYMGPQCETISGFLNTSWLEDILAKNSWKNDFSRVGLLY
ncbi:hypothetical protein MACJ_003997 [Theileria orientalis]|uniref:EGF-like domain-containing protein n=1 Tax=Theileria orientalis TaxID=68886 RepID=A0A976SKU7_THEOR|nr:hypothetical protein MACJ_003997 [Theileria orientalis]